MGSTRNFAYNALHCAKKKRGERARATAKNSQRLAAFLPTPPTLANALSKPIAELVVDLHAFFGADPLLDSLFYFYRRFDCSILIAIIPLALFRSEGSTSFVSS